MLVGTGRSASLIRLNASTLARTAARTRRRPKLRLSIAIEFFCTTRMMKLLWPEKSIYTSVLANDWRYKCLKKRYLELWLDMFYTLSFSLSLSISLFVCLKKKCKKPQVRVLLRNFFSISTKLFIKICICFVICRFNWLITAFLVLELEIN